MNFADIPLAGFKSHIRAKVIPAGMACLVSERDLTTLPGSAITRLTPSLDGTPTVAELTRDVKGGEGNVHLNGRAATDPAPVPSLAGSRQRLLDAGMRCCKPDDITTLGRTCPDINMPAVTGVVPLPRHFRSQFAAGRLFEVTVRPGPLTKGAS